MNGITGDRFGYTRSRAAGVSWRQGFAAHDRRIRWRMAMICASALPLPYESYQGAWRVLRVLNEIETPDLVHWDMHNGNIFVDPATLASDRRIDFERALWGDPLMECNFGAFMDSVHSTWDTARRCWRRKPATSQSVVQRLSISDHGHRVRLSPIRDTGPGELGQAAA